tara:strand:+ start:303 stop:1169 length:867 start_codon:yes stop_codon:yes gene_type:complete
MTGYGRGEVNKRGYSCVVEARSVNHRFLDVFMKLPKRFAHLENPIRQIVKERFSRGRFDITFLWKSLEEGEKELQIDRNLAGQYIAAFQKLKKEFGLTGKVRAEILASFKDIFQLVDREENLENAWEILSEGLTHALDALENMRKIEGQALEKDILGRIENLNGHIQKIKTQYPAALTEYHERLKERIRDISENVDIDPQRLAQEIALLAEKSDISEELTRLESHTQQFSSLLHEEVSVGRTLEFILQEANRETNTLSVKANDYKVSQLAVVIKSELEKIREQINNIE